MSDFGSSVDIQAPAHMVFEFVSDPVNMPRYLPTVSHASLQGPDRVMMKGEVQGHKYQGDGWFVADVESLQMSWGSDGESRYSGLLTVKATGEATSTAEVKISFEPMPDQEARFREQMGTREGMIQQGLDRAMMSIKLICEGEPDRDVPARLQPGKRYMG